MVSLWRWKKLGGHVHVAVFCGKDWDHLGKCGDVVYREDEWEWWRMELLKISNVVTKDESPVES